MRHTQILTHNWLFTHGHEVPSKLSDGHDYQHVCLPHNAVDVPLSYFDESTLQQPFTYHYQLQCSKDDLTHHLIMRFEGALSDAHVYVNGTLVEQHADGYTPFEAYLNPALKIGENLITVTISGEENPAIPPFGGRIDYICFPGIYRPVSLSRFDAVRIRNIKVTPVDVLTEPTVELAVYLQSFASTDEPLELQAALFTDDGELLKVTDWLDVSGSHQPILLKLAELPEISLWSPTQPTLYRLMVTLRGDGINDEYQCRFGFREACFTPQGFWLNGEPLKLVGVNRHQSYPYIGYAMGKRGQRLDAEIIKNELGFNFVRTSHYPQSPDFLDRCDELGLLVFEEIAGWQHIGDEVWQQASVENVGAMIERDWNHPAIVLWGVRINESPDHHDFYEQTNALAHELDPSRQTGGVRCISDSELLEDVYTMNDFVLKDSQLNPDGLHALRNPSNVTGLGKEVPYLVTEYAGHMFPTKLSDNETWQNEHVMRHLRVLDASFANPNISGTIAWCLFDYNTHHDFGSGDKICYHGITDAFRVPKWAAAVYTSQQDPSERPVLKAITYWTRGERPEAKALPLMILTNCDRIEVEVVGHVRTYLPDRTRFPHLPHPPIIIDATNQSDLPVGDWGYDWNDLKIRGYVDDLEVCATTLAASPLPQRLAISQQCEQLQANNNDCCRVVLQALDQQDQRLPYLRDVVRLKCSEQLQIIGPSQLAFEGGCIAFWVRGMSPGAGLLAIHSSIFGTQQIAITVVEQEVSHG